jgi:hypothetical protein
MNVITALVKRKTAPKKKLSIKLPRRIVSAFFTRDLISLFDHVTRSSRLVWWLHWNVFL